MIKNNKKRNIGVIYESLIYSVLDLIAENKTDDAKKLFFVIKKYFMNESSQINKVYKIYSQLLYNESRNEFFASKMLQYLLNDCKKVDELKLRLETNRLLESIQKSVPNYNKILNRKIPNYKLYSSFWALNNTQNLMLAEEKIECEHMIIEHMLNNTEIQSLKQIQEQKNENFDPALYNITQVLLLRKFKEKYKDILSEEQNDVLIKYYMADSDKSFSRFIEKKSKNLIEYFDVKKNILKSDEMKNKLEMVTEKLSILRNRDRINNDDLTNVILAIELKKSLEEIGE
jgi:hypothetical protein